MEDNIHITWARLHAYCEHHGLAKGVLEHIRVLGPHSQFPRLGDPVQADAWMLAMESMFSDYGWECLYIDNLTKIASGHTDLNNDQAAADLIGRFHRIAQAGCHVRVLAHPRKSMRGDNSVLDIQDIRGSGAFGQLVRSSSTMHKRHDGDRFIYEFHPGKDNNRPESGEPETYVMRSVLPDCWPEGNEVAVLESYQSPDPLDRLPPDQVREVLIAVAALDPGQRRDSSQSGGWIGAAIAERVGMDPKLDKQPITKMLDAWIKSGVLKRETVTGKKAGVNNGRTIQIIGPGPEFEKMKSGGIGETVDLDEY